MRKGILLDTGPLVAFLNRRDRHHAWARDVFEEIAAPVRTCEAVISEACFLLQRIPHGAQSVFELLSQGLIAVPFHLDTELGPIQKLLKKYGDVPMSLADACLVRMAEQDSRGTVMTLDSDFRRYRKNGREALRLLTP